MERTILRTLDQLAKDCVWPTPGLSGPDLEESRRHWGIAQVLLTMPEDDYQRLTEIIDSFTWFIPDLETRAGVWPFPPTVEAQEFMDPVTGKPTGMKWREYAKVLYLSPQLEDASGDVVAVIVAHELAHLVLGHNVIGNNPDQDDRQEEEVWERVRRWGFSREVTRALAVHKRRETRERNLIAELNGN